MAGWDKIVCNRPETFQKVLPLSTDHCGTMALHLYDMCSMDFTFIQGTFFHAIFSSSINSLVTVTEYEMRLWLTITLRHLSPKVLRL